MISLTKVVVDNLYETIHEYVTKRELIVDDYEAMVEVILSMIKDGYCFAMDRDLLRDAMESLTYMYAPSDDMNKDRLVHQFADEEDDSDDDDDEECVEDNDDFNNMDLMKMMQMMGGMGGMGGMGEVPTTSEEKCPEGEFKKVMTETSDSTGEDPTTTTVVKEDIDDSNSGDAIAEGTTTEGTTTEGTTTEDTTTEDTTTEDITAENANVD